MASLLQLSSDDLIARSIAPIKREFIVLHAAPRKPEDGAAAPTGQAQRKPQGKRAKKVRPCRSPAAQTPAAAGVWR
jgi:hypothetical protein